LVFNLHHEKWQSYHEGPSPFQLTPLYWTGSSKPELVSIEKIQSHKKTSFRVFSYQPKKQEVSSCLIDSENAENYRLVRGNTYPYIYFYWPSYTSKGITIHFAIYHTHSLMSGRCLPIWTPFKIINVKQPPGVEVEDVYKYGVSGPTALTFSNPDKPLVIHYRLRSEEEGKCYVYSTENQKPLLVTAAEPTIVGLAPHHGLSFYTLSAGLGKRVDFLSSTPIEDLDVKRIWKLQSEKSLLIAPTMGRSRQVFKITMKPTN